MCLNLFCILFLISLSYSFGQVTGCPCLSTTVGTDLDQYRDSPGGSLVSGDINLPSDYGVGCSAHDANLDPFCAGSNPPQWCEYSFCFVENCDHETYTSGYFPESLIKLSYETCSQKSTYESLFGEGSSGTSTIGELVDVTEGYVTNLKTFFEEEYTLLSGADDYDDSSACEYKSSCPCSTCESVPGWGSTGESRLCLKQLSNM